MSNPVKFFVKFLDSERVSSLVDEGILYMNCLKYFREHEDQEARGDIKEGFSYTFSGNNTQISVSGMNIGEIVTANIQYSYEECINIFCMTEIRQSDIQEMSNSRVFKFDPGFRKLGDTAIIIPGPNVPIFLKRIKVSYEKNDDLIQVPDEPKYAKRVEYVNDNYSGPYGPFKKNIQQAWQNEWRFVLLRGARKLYPKPYIFKIEPISDICVQYKTETLISLGIMLER